MSRAAARFTEADVSRAIKAAKKHGAGCVEIKPDGTIQVIISPQSTAEVEPKEPPAPKKRPVL